MDGQRLLLMDGTTIDGGTAGYASGFLWCWFTGYTLQEAAQIFFDPTKTGRIVFQFGEMSETYEGYTNCTSISIDIDGRVSVCMKKGVEA